MNKPIRDVNLSFSCLANWDGMKPCSVGKFCDSCSKPVYDFTNKNAADLQKALIKNGGELCGHFNASQLSQPHSRFGYFKKLLAASLLFFGISVFEAKAQRGVIICSSPSITYPKQDSGLEKYLIDNIDLSKNDSEGEISIGFMVDSLGKVTRSYVVKGYNEAIANQALAVLNSIVFEIDQLSPSTHHEDVPPRKRDFLLVLEIKRNKLRVTHSPLCPVPH